MDGVQRAGDRLLRGALGRRAPAAALRAVVLVVPLLAAAPAVQATTDARNPVHGPVAAGLGRLAGLGATLDVGSPRPQALASTDLTGHPVSVTTPWSALGGRGLEPGRAGAAPPPGPRDPVALEAPTRSGMLPAADDATAGEHLEWPLLLLAGVGALLLLGARRRRTT